MDATAVDAIARLERDKKRWFQVPAEPNDVYFIVDSEGSSVRYVGEHPLPSVRCYSTEALVVFALAEVGAGNITTLFYSADKVQALVVEAHDEPRNRIHTLRLPLHPVFKLLEQLTQTRTFDQKALIRFLRAELNGNVDDAVIQQFRHLKLKSDGEGSAVVDKGRSGVSRSLMQSVNFQGGQPPDVIRVAVPVYDVAEMLDSKHSVDVLLDYAPNAEGQAVFELTTVYSGLQDARSKALSELAESLSGHDLPVVYGEV